MSVTVDEELRSLARAIECEEGQKETAVSKQDYETACRHRDRIDRYRSERLRLLLKRREENRFLS